jgi:hypothetical protein
MTSQETKSIKSIPYQANPKTVEQICDAYNKPEALKHCAGMMVDGKKCDGHYAFFCYQPPKKIVGDYNI